MQIELRKLRISRALSEETTAYSAEIWIDGQLAFRATNNGHGGCDMYRSTGVLNEKTVNAWLLANRPVRDAHGMTLGHDLETEVADLIDRSMAIASIRRKLRTRILTIEDDAVYSYAIGKRPAAIVAAKIRRTRPSAIIVNDAGEEIIARAAAFLAPA